ncbi:MAG: hypothetical protein ACHRXM_12820 [Isosphaerales bacterium]
MNCRDFERTCNELIDAGSRVIGQAAAGGDAPGARSPARSTAEPEPAANDRERLLLDHAAGCPACREVAARYETLRLALRVWGPPPAAPAGLADRILAAAQAEAPSLPRWRGGTYRTQRFWQAGLPLATVAAAVVAAVTVGLLMPKLTVDQSRLNHPTPRAAVSPSGGHAASASPASADARALNEAVAGATAATWDLARSASEPAARISRQVLDAATGPELNPSVPGPGGDSVSVPSLGSLAPDSATAVAMLQQVGDRLATGVRPLSTTARHAFGFLLGPTLAKPEVRTNPPAAKGA